MIVKIFLLLWVFILPVLSFLWEIFYRKKDITPPLNKRGIKTFHKELVLFTIIIPIFLILWFFIFFIKESSVSALWDGLVDLFNNLYTLKIPLWKVCMWEILYLDIAIGLMFSWRTSYSIKKIFNWQWIKENWPMIEASLPCQRLWSIVHAIIIVFSVYNLGNTECKFVLILYPITSYFYAKKVYTYDVFYKKGFCKLNREDN